MLSVVGCPALNGGVQIATSLFSGLQIRFTTRLDQVARLCHKLSNRRCVEALPVDGPLQSHRSGVSFQTNRHVIRTDAIQSPH